MRTSFLGKVHVMPSKYDPETRAKAVRLVLKHRDDYPSEWAAITAVSKRLGMNAETLAPPGRSAAVTPGSSDRRCHPSLGCRISVYEREIR